MADKKQRKPRTQVKSNELFDGAKKTARNCPKCGPGYTMAKHKDRLHCGHCGYTEFTSKSEEKKE